MNQAKEAADSVLSEVTGTAIAENTILEKLSPSEKKAQAEQKADVVLDSLPNLKQDVAMHNDQGTNDTTTVMTAIADAQSKPTKNTAAVAASTSSAPGAFFKKENDTKIGWNAFSHLPNSGDEAALNELTSALGLENVINMYKGSRPAVSANEEDLVSKFLTEAYYGEWYHNAAVMLFTVVFTWILSRFGGGLMACLVVGAFLSTYYQTSIRRLRRNIRDDIQREMAINRLESETESADWINHFMSRFWLIYEPVLSAQIIGTADSILVESTPSFLDSIRLTQFTLGTKAPRIESIKTLTKTEPNVVCMDWKFSFIPNDTLDLSERDLQSKVNPKIVLTIRVGKGFVGAGIPVLLEDIAFSGHLRLKFKMFNEFPHIKTVEASFLERPHFDYVLKPVGGEAFGFDINNIPGLESFVQEQVHATLGPMMYSPNVFTLDVAGMMSGATDLNSANGVLVIKAHSASGLKDSDMFGSMDPYITFHVGNANNAEVGRTKHIENSKNPKFDETLFVLLNNPNDSLVMQIMDRNTGRSDAHVGDCVFDLKTLSESDNFADGVSIPALKKGKVVGEAKFDFHYFPMNLPDKQDDGIVIPAVESNSGILRFTVHECKELGGGAHKSGSGGLSIPVIGGSSELNPYATVTVNGQQKLKTHVYKRSINPRWDKQIELFVTDKTQLNLAVSIFDSGSDKKLGNWSSMLEEFEENCFVSGQDWWNLKDGSGKIHMSMQWKPITMTGLAEGFSSGDGYKPPIGVVRVEMIRANNLKNVEALTGGKSDPYIRIMSGVQNRGQTEHIDDNLDPEWEQTLYVPIHSKREDLIFEVMDYNDVQNDKSLGVTDLLLRDVLRETKREDGQLVYDGLDPIERTVDLVSLDRKKGRGTLTYKASFYPTLALAKEDDNKKKDEQSSHQSYESNSNISDEPELIEKPKELPEKDLHGEVIKYKTLSADKKTIDLTAYESGVLAVTMHTLNLKDHQKVSVDVCLDSATAQYSTIEQKGLAIQINETGTVFVKELDFSKLRIRIRDRPGEEREGHVFPYVSLEVRKVVERLIQAAEEDHSGSPFIEEVALLESNGASISLSFTFTPVIRFKLDPSESLENQGELSVRVIKANNLKAVDRSGTSDPLVRFYVGKDRVFKTETYKKTINPTFSKEETFTVPVVNRTKTFILAKIFDWDQVGKDTPIGECKIYFTGNEIETFVASTKEYPIDQGGSLTLQLIWRPSLVVRQRTSNNAFSATTRILTHGSGAAFGAGKDVLGGAGREVLGAGGKVFGAFGSLAKIGSKKATPSKMGEVSPPPIPPIPSNTGGEGGNDSSSVHSSASPTDSTVVSGSVQHQQTRSISNDESYQVRVSLIEAKNLKAMDRGGTSDPYCRVRIGDKLVHKTKHLKKTLSPEWNESFITSATAESKWDLKVKDHNTITDVDIGGHEFVLKDIMPDRKPFDGWLQLSDGTGEIRVHIEVIDSDSVSTTSKSGGLFSKK